MASARPAADRSAPSSIRGITYGGVARAAGATLFWSTSALLISQLSGPDGLSALQISVWRVLFVLPALMVVIALRRPAAFRIGAADVPALVISGIVGVALSYVTWASSVHLNGPAAAAAISFVAPALIAVGDRVFFGTRLSRWQRLAILVNLVGCALASGVRSPSDLIHSPGGVLIGLTNGLMFAIYTLLNRRVAFARARDPLTVLLGMFAIGAIALLLWGLPLEGARLLQPNLDGEGWARLAGVALGPTLLAYALFNSSLKELPATIAGLIITLEPPLVAVFAYLLLGKAISEIQWIGIGLIVGAVVVINLSRVTHNPSDHVDR